MEVGGGVEPEVQALLPVAAAVDEDVGLEGDGDAGLVAEELEVHLVAAAIFRLRDELELCMGVDAPKGLRLDPQQSNRVLQVYGSILRRG